MQDGLDTCQCAVGNGDRLTNGWTDGCTGTDTHSLGNESVVPGYHYKQREANNQSAAVVLRHCRTMEKIFFFQL